MEVSHTLPRIGAFVYDHTVTGGGGGATRARCGAEQIADFTRVRFGDEITEVSDVAFRDHEQVRRCLRGYVSKDQHVVCSRDFLRRYLAGEDLAKRALGIGHVQPFSPLP